MAEVRSSGFAMSICGCSRLGMGRVRLIVYTCLADVALRIAPCVSRQNACGEGLPRNISWLLSGRAFRLTGCLHRHDVARFFAIAPVPVDAEPQAFFE